MKKISSINNPIVKEVLKLQEKSKERRKKGLFIVEGKRELSLAQKGKYEIQRVFFNASIVDFNTVKDDFFANEYIEISNDVYKKLAYRGSTEGIVATVKIKNHSIDNTTLSRKNPLVLVLEGLEKPGNIGAILRTADAANVDAVFIADPKTDVYNPNLIRSSVGCVFTNQIIVENSIKIIEFLNQNQINIFSATLQNSNNYFENDFTHPTALVVGTEATGLTKIWRDKALKNIKIPMEGAIDSMNVSVACAILTFEAKRQRNIV